MPRRVLVSWIGNTDLKATGKESADDVGPIAQAIAARPFDEVHLLSDHPKLKRDEYVDWLRRRTPAIVKVHQQRLSSPTNFRDIYNAADAVLGGLWKSKGAGLDCVLHLSPGTPAMAAVWILLGKTSYPAEFLQSSREAGVETADIPFDIAAEFLPELLRVAEERRVALSEARPPESAAFENIIHRGPVMKQLIGEAKRAAVGRLPILIEGESGTGKELLAKAMHAASPRREKEIVVVNCGAIPSELIESELFGHAKGAFTGADRERKGYFEAASGSTLFLDEIGELPKPAQVKLLRVLQEGEVIPVGERKPRKVDLRIIAATNRSLVDEVAAGNFREDLFYRLAVVILKLPPIRGRKGDLSPLIDGILDHVNRQSALEPGYINKKLSPGARNLLLQHEWPGNVREMTNTLQRACLWAEGGVISPDVAQRAILGAPVGAGVQAMILDREIEGGVPLEELMAQVARHYIERALAHTSNNRTQAAALLGFKSYQTLTNWMDRYGVAK